MLQLLKRYRLETNLPRLTVPAPARPGNHENKASIRLPTLKVGTPPECSSFTMARPMQSRSFFSSGVHGRCITMHACMPLQPN